MSDTPKSNKQLLLNALYQPYKNCMFCPLGSLGRTQVVFGRGNPDASLVIIGEAPGAQEDKEGLPFIGRSGKLLTTLLQQAGLTESEYFITNIAKCRPPLNRTPTIQEAKTCMELLLIKQLHIIQPRIICTLGACAYQNLTEDMSSISLLRGSERMWNSYTVIPTFHPAYALRNKQARTLLAQDLALIARKTQT